MRHFLSRRHYDFDRRLFLFQTLIVIKRRDARQIYAFVRVMSVYCDVSFRKPTVTDSWKGREWHLMYKSSTSCLLQGGKAQIHCTYMTNSIHTVNQIKYVRSKKNKIRRWKPMSKRPIGRPKTRWKDDVLGDIRSLNVNYWKKLNWGHPFVYVKLNIGKTREKQENYVLLVTQSK
jgi:hypothetical protein